MCTIRSIFAVSAAVGFAFTGNAESVSLQGEKLVAQLQMLGFAEAQSTCVVASLEENFEFLDHKKLLVGLSGPDAEQKFSQMNQEEPSAFLVGLGAFQEIVGYGTGDPKIMAAGLSVAEVVAQECAPELLEEGS